jgi:hypothetical protein
MLAAVDFTQLSFVVGLIGAGVGAFLGAYLSEKGKNRATREDVDRLARAVEEMKSEITGDLWLRQRKWDFKREIYSGMLQHLAAVRHSAVVAEATLLVCGEPTSGQIHADLVALMLGIKDTIGELRKLTSIGALFLSQAAITAVEQLGKDEVVVPAETLSAGLRSVMAFADVATAKIIAEARADLKL